MNVRSRNTSLGRNTFRHGIRVVGGVAVFLGGCSISRGPADSYVLEDWLVEDLLQSERARVLGSPEVVSSPWGEAVLFDGVGDGIFLPYNPLVGHSRFTVEVLMRPDGDAPMAQRYLHFGQVDGDRVLLETRVTPERQWYHDSYVQSGESNFPLIDAERLHPTDRWHHVALVFDQGNFVTYIDGEREGEGRVEFTPHTDGMTSIGVRMNELYWYKGQMYRIRLSSRPLEPHEFKRN